jgi:hypothetical protein
MRPVPPMTTIFMVTSFVWAERLALRKASRSALLWSSPVRAKRSDPSTVHLVPDDRLRGTPQSRPVPGRGTSEGNWEVADAEVSRVATELTGAILAV